MDNELAAYGACDPVKLEETRRGITLAKEATIRWTGQSCQAVTRRATNIGIDNFSIVMPYLLRQTCIEASEVRRHLGVDDEYEDIC